MHSAVLQNGYWVWADQQQAIQVRFVGRGPRSNREQMARATLDRGLPFSWAEQVHSASVLQARPGHCGRGDALVTRQRGLALTVTVADCVPVLLGSQETIAAVHAGWRGITAGLVASALESLGEPPERLVAWIGPAIGPCCYEVGQEVAERVARASSPRVVVSGPRGRPHLDLPAAVCEQLEAASVLKIRRLGWCTACDDRRLWSYRRDGPAGGRNLALTWLSP